MTRARFDRGVWHCRAEPGVSRPSRSRCQAQGAVSPSERARLAISWVEESMSATAQKMLLRRPSGSLLVALSLLGACDEAVDPAAQAVSVEITTSRDVLLGGDTLRFRAEARDAEGRTVVGAPLEWSVSDLALAAMVDPLAGVLVARNARGTAQVRVRVPSGATDSASLLVQPRPVALEVVTGDGQRGIMNRALPAPLVVVAVAEDAIGVAGVLIRFTADEDGGLFTPSIAVTDTAGRATAGWLLGEASTPHARAVTLIPESLAVAFTATVLIPGMWTWVSGDSMTGVPPVYGMQGVPDSANTPGSRGGAMHVIGSDGTLWLVAGFTQAGGFALRNDVWRLRDGLWTWIAGSNQPNPNSSFGTKGVASSANVPPGRANGAVWLDHSGHLWLYGGAGDDLWRYDGSAWTWIAGDSVPGQAPVYGQLGVAHAANTPGTRDFGVGPHWLDNEGRRWLYGAGAGNQGRSDLWRHDATGWVWVGGDSTKGQWPRHGQLGVPESGNTPGVRSGSGRWIAGGFLWLFAGGGLDRNAAETFALGDVWRFDGSRWAWMAGSQDGLSRGVYGLRGVFDMTSLIGSRTSPAVHRANGIVWVFGGSGIDGAGRTGTLNDLWQFDGTRWAWHAGRSELPPMTFVAPGSWGVRGVTDPSNTPNGRTGSALWETPDGTLWLYGGRSHVDLWRYDQTRLP